MNFALCGQFWWPNQKYFYLKVVAHIRCHAYWIIYPFAILNSPKIEERGALFYEPNFPVFSNLEWFFWIMVLEELVTIFCPIIWSLMWFFDLLSEKIQKRPNSIFWLIECPHYTVNHYGISFMTNMRNKADQTNYLPTYVHPQSLQAFFTSIALKSLKTEGQPLSG